MIKAVNQYDDENNYMFTYESITKAAEITGISEIDIINCCNGAYKTAGGYIWRYARG